MGIIRDEKSRRMLNSHCNNNDQKEIKLKKKICEKKKCPHQDARCGLIDTHASYFAMESAANR